MKDYFFTLTGEVFPFFGFSHIAVICVYFALLASILILFKVKSANQRIFSWIRWTFFTLLILWETAYHIWASLNGFWYLSTYLPFHLCSIASLVCAFALLTLNRRLIVLGFFIGFIPALAAILTPELIYDFPHFRFILFFGQHITISLSALFLLLDNRLHITLKDTFESYAVLLTYAAFIGFLINPLLGSNYLFLSSKPVASTPLDFLGEGFWYYVNACLLALVLFLALFWLAKALRRLYRANGKFK